MNTLMDRRLFLQGIAVAGGSAALAQAALSDWKRKAGLELWTVRELLAKDFEGTMAKVAEIGYKEVEPVGYGGLDPKAFRALLDRLKMTAPSTHAGATEGPNLEKELEGFRVMGFKYIEIRGGAQGRPPLTVEGIKQRAAGINRHGDIAKKFGMKMLIHNHTEEFEHLEGGKLTMYDVLLAETNPATVAMQLDIGWASVAGQNILEMFHKSPGRYELWHVKDATGIKSAPANATPAARRKLAKLVPIGEGDVDYGPIFAQAKLAGLKHYAIEQDNAAASGDAIGAARTSYQNLMKILSK
jgi:sugar phosphate isomerase/epimerase